MSLIRQLFLSSVILVSVNARIVEENQVKILKLQDCPHTNFPMRLYTSVQQIGKGRFVMDGRVSVAEDIRNMTLLEARINKCRSYSETETCEYFTTCKYKSPCPLITARKQFWSSFLDNVHPPMRCPLKKGNYLMRNASFDSSLINSFVEMKGMYWDVKIKGYDGKKCITCLEIGIDFRKVRRKIH